MRVTEVEIRQWKDHPVTRKVLQYLHDVREDLKEEWAEGHIDRENPHPQVRANVYGEIIDIDAEIIMRFYDKEEEHEHEPEREDSRASGS